MCPAVRDGSLETEGEEQRGQKGDRVELLFCSGSFLGRTGQSCRLSSTNRGLWPCRSYSSDFAKKQDRSIWSEAFSKSMLGGIALRRYRVFGAIVGWCARWLHNRCWPPAPAGSVGAFGNSGQQIFRSETSESPSDGHGPVAPILLLQGCDRRTCAIQETTGHGMLPSAIIRTIVCRKVITSSL